jgi:hypothetical protein
MVKYYLLCFLPIFLPALASTALKNLFIVPVFIYSLIVVFFRSKLNSFSIYFSVSLFFLLIVQPTISSVFWGIEPTEANLNEIFKLLTYLFYGLSLYLLKQKITLDELSKIIIVFVLLNAFLALIIYVDSSLANAVFLLYHVESDANEFMQYLLSRPSGAFGNPNALGLALCLCALYFLVLDKKFFLILTFLLMLLTQSRTAFFCFTICFLINLVVERKIIHIFIIVVLASVFIVYLTTSENLIISTLYSRFSDISLAGRDSLWLNLFDSEFFEKAYFGLLVIPHDVHFLDNEYLNVYIRYGFVTFIFLFFLILMLIFKHILIISKTSSTSAQYDNVKKVGVVIVYSLLVIMLASITAAISTMLKFFLFYLFFYFSLTKVHYGQVKL